MSATSRPALLPALGLPSAGQQPPAAAGQSQSARRSPAKQQQPPRGRPAVYVGTPANKTEEHPVASASASPYSPTSATRSIKPTDSTYSLLAGLTSPAAQQQPQQQQPHRSPKWKRYNGASGHPLMSPLSSPSTGSPRDATMGSPRKRQGQSGAAKTSLAMGARPALAALKPTTAVATTASTVNLLSPRASQALLSPQPSPLSPSAHPNSVVFIPEVSQVEKKRVHLMRSKPFLTSGLTPGSYVTYQPAHAQHPSQSPFASPRSKQPSKHLLTTHKPLRPGTTTSHHEGDALLNEVAEKLRRHQIADGQRKREFEDIQAHRQRRQPSHSKSIPKFNFSVASPRSSGEFTAPLSPRGSSLPVKARDSALILAHPTTLQFRRHGETLGFTVQNVQSSVVTVQARIESASDKYHLVSSSGSGASSSNAESPLFLYPGQTVSIQVTSDWSRVDAERDAEEELTGAPLSESAAWGLHAGTLVLLAQPLNRSYAGTSAKFVPRARIHQQTRIYLERRPNTPTPTDDHDVNDNEDEDVTMTMTSSTPKSRSDELTTQPPEHAESEQKEESPPAALTPAATVASPETRDPLLVAIESAMRHLESLKGVKTDLLAYTRPPPAAILHVLEAAMVWLGAEPGVGLGAGSRDVDADWRAIKAALRSRDLLPRMRSLSLAAIPPRALRAVVRLMTKQPPAYDSEAVAQESPAAAAFAQWVLAVEAWMRRAHPKEIRSPPPIDPDLTQLSPKVHARWLDHHGKLDPRVHQRASAMDVHLVAFAMKPDENERRMILALMRDQSAANQQQPPQEGQLHANGVGHDEKSAPAAVEAQDGFYRHYPPLQWSAASEQVALARIGGLSLVLRRGEYECGYRAHRAYFDHDDPLLESTNVRPPANSQAMRRMIDSYTSFPSVVTPAYHIALQRRARMRIEMAIEGGANRQRRRREEDARRLDASERMVDQRLAELKRFREAGVATHLSAGLAEEDHLHVPLHATE